MVKGKPTYARLRLATSDGDLVSGGYKSGRSADRDMPDKVSSLSTRSAGTPFRRHLSTACGEISKALARPTRPQTSIARSTKGLGSMSSSQPQVDEPVNLRLVVCLNRGFHHGSMSPLGKIIIRELDRMKRSQSWLAEELEVSENAVSKWIATGKISRANAEKLSPKIGVSLDQLLGPKGAPDPDDEWRKLSPLLKSRLISIVHDIRGAAVEEEQPAPRRRAKS